MLATVELRGAFEDGLHEVVREGLVDLRTSLETVDRRLPGYVERELERFLVCGDPRQGFAWLTCDGCPHHHRPVGSGSWALDLRHPGAP